MRICIIGSGATGLLLSILLKLNKKQNNNEVFVIEKNNKIAKKLYATGNGKCNIGNTYYLTKDEIYNDDFALSLLDRFNIVDQRDFFLTNGFATKIVNDLCYPSSESASSFINGLVNYAKKLGVHFILETTFFDYKINDNKINVITAPRLNNDVFDKLVITTGGASSPKMGTDGYVFNMLSNHQYKISKLYPGLAPICTNEITAPVNGLRLKCKATLISNDKNLYIESGEVLFKDNGLSGICIMNICSIIARNILNNKNNTSFKIVLDCVDSISLDEFRTVLKFNMENKKPLLSGLFHDQLVKYFELLIKDIEKLSIEDIYQSLSKLTFTFKNFYSFDNSQVTVGGLEISNINKNSLESLHEKNVFFGGEILNIDGLCGGNNLMFCFSCSKVIADSINK
ncbi:MAG: aminoacetone oxidase family FAD-binding enzyme [Bacilli bacterium]